MISCHVHLYFESNCPSSSSSSISSSVVDLCMTSKCEFKLFAKGDNSTKYEQLFHP